MRCLGSGVAAESPASPHRHGHHRFKSATSGSPQAGRHFEIRRQPPTRDVVKTTMRTLKRERKGHTDRGGRRAFCKAIACHAFRSVSPPHLGPGAAGLQHLAQSQRAVTAAAEAEQHLRAALHKQTRKPNYPYMISRKRSSAHIRLSMVNQKVIPEDLTGLFGPFEGL